MGELPVGGGTHHFWTAEERTIWLLKGRDNRDKVAWYDKYQPHVISNWKYSQQRSLSAKAEKAKSSNKLFLKQDLNEKRKLSSGGEGSGESETFAGKRTKKAKTLRIIKIFGSTQESQCYVFVCLVNTVLTFLWSEQEGQPSKHIFHLKIDQKSFKKIKFFKIYTEVFINLPLL